MGLRVTLNGTMAALGVVLATPAAAQDAAPATNQAAPATNQAAPAPGSVGDPRLQDFDLNGTVTRAPTPTPTPSPAPTATPAPEPTPARDAPATAAPGAARSAPERSVAPTATAPTDAPLPAPEAIDTPAPTAEASPVLPSSSTDLMPPPSAEPSAAFGWPALLALLVALGTGAAWWWRRRREGEELAYAGSAPTAFERSPVPDPAPAPAPAPRPAPSPAPVLDGGIVSRALHPKLALDLQPLLMESDEKGNVRLTFELTVANVGSAPARDVRLEAKLFNAGPTQDRDIAVFFRSPGAMPTKLPAIGPQDRLPLRSRVGMRTEDYQPLSLAGRDLVVPMLAVNAVFRGSAGEEQQSASWLVGALPGGSEEAEKLAPFPLGKASSVTTLAARLHSSGLPS